jgi:hypothetical protein
MVNPETGDLVWDVPTVLSRKIVGLMLITGRGLREFLYSSGPKWLTEVRREPKVDEGN